MMNKYVLVGIAVLIVVFAVYFVIGTKPSLESLGIVPGGSSPGGVAQTPDEALNKVIQKLTLDGLPKDKWIVKDSAGAAGGGGEGGGTGGNACSGSKYLAGTSDYFVKARVDRIETRWSDDGKPMIAYVYAGVDEYEKINGTLGDINPDDLLILSVADTDAVSEDTITVSEPTFTYLYLKKEEWGFSTVC